MGLTFGSAAPSLPLNRHLRNSYSLTLLEKLLFPSCQQSFLFCFVITIRCASVPFPLNFLWAVSNVALLIPSKPSIFMCKQWEKTKGIEQRQTRENERRKKGLHLIFSLWDSIGIPERYFLKDVCTVSYSPSPQRSASFGGLSLPFNQSNTSFCLLLS